MEVKAARDELDEEVDYLKLIEFEKGLEEHNEMSKIVKKVQEKVNMSMTTRCLWIAGLLILSAWTVLLLTVFVVIPFLWPATKQIIDNMPIERVPDWEFMNRTGFMNKASVFHLIPHSHQDLGWLKTEQGYYKDAVESVIKTSLKYMENNPQAKFVLSDMGFVRMHFMKHPEDIPRMRNLTRTGQLNIINGAYVLNDEAGCAFDDILSNFQWGRKFTWENIGVIPRSAWNIDQFGQSKSFSKMLRELGYNENLINRISEDTKVELTKKKGLLLNWTLGPNENDNQMSYILRKHYSAPVPLWDDYFDKLRNRFHVDFFNSDFNFLLTFTSFLTTLVDTQPGYNTRHVLLTDGDDFAYDNYEERIRPTELVVIFANCNNNTGRFAGKFELRISTLANYFSEVKNEVNASNPYPTYSSDFFPYIEYSMNDSSHHAWSGYFTTNPLAKKSMRSYGELYRGLRSILTVMMIIDPSTTFSYSQALISNTSESEWIVGGNQHHDTITGTSRNPVAMHYLFRQLADLRRSRLFWKSMLKSILVVATGQSSSDESKGYPFAYPAVPNDVYTNAFLNQQFYQLENQSLTTDNWDFMFLNPVDENIVINKSMDCLFINQAHESARIIRVISISPALQVTDLTSGTTLKVFSSCRKNGNCEHMILANFTAFQPVLLRFVVLGGNSPSTTPIPHKSDTTIGTSPVSVHYDPSSGTIRLFSSDPKVMGGNSLTIFIGYYTIINNDPDDYSSPDLMNNPGKYLFTTNIRDPFPLTIGTVNYQFDKDTGAFVINYDIGYFPCIFQIQYLPFAPENQRISQRFECEAFNFTAPENVELIIRYMTNIKNKGKFYTDGNGLYSMERTVGQYGPYIECNYYPLTRFIYLNDSTKRFSVTIDRAEGGGSTSEGVLEVMINRKTETDDIKGASEPAIEGLDISGIHYLNFESTANQTHDFRRLQIELDNPLIAFSLRPLSSGMKFSLASNPGLPKNTQFTSSNNIRVSFDTVYGNSSSIFMRVFNMNDAQTVSFNATQAVLNITGVLPKTIIERPIDLNFDFETLDSLGDRWPGYQTPWNTSSTANVTGTFVFEPLKIRAFLLGF